MKSELLPRRPLIALSSLFLFACPMDEDSIGKDECTGEHTSCRAPEADDVFRNPPGEHQVLTASLATLAPSWRKPLSFPNVSESALEAGRLVGAGPNALWHVRPSSDGRAIELFELDDSGGVTFRSSVEAPAALSEGAYASWDEDVYWSYTEVSSQQAPGPVLSVGWSQRCGMSHSIAIECGREELLFFSEGPAAPPWRFERSARGLLAADGDGWVFDYARSLFKLGKSGQIVLQQALIAGDAAHQGGWPDGIQPAVLLPAGGLALSVMVYDGSLHPQLWHLDDHGSPMYKANLPGWFESAASFTDRSSRHVVAAVTSDGDLSLLRMNTETNQYERGYRVVRDGYPALHVRSFAQDEADNLYFLLESGTNAQKVPMVCQLPFEGGVTCLALPELTSTQIVGGPAGVLYAEVPASSGNAESMASGLSLLRFDFPDPPPAPAPDASPLP